MTLAYAPHKATVGLRITTVVSIKTTVVIYKTTVVSLKPTVVLINPTVVSSKTTVVLTLPIGWRLTPARLIWYNSCVGWVRHVGWSYIKAGW